MAKGYRKIGIALGAEVIIGVVILLFGEDSGMAFSSAEEAREALELRAKRKRKNLRLLPQRGSTSGYRYNVQENNRG